MTPSKRAKLLELLNQLYPEPKSELEFDGEYQLVVAVALSAQCTDKKVNETAPALFERYPDFKSLANAKLADVEKLIRPINYYKTKARNLLAMAERVCSDFSGRLPRSHNELVTLPGVGQKTANVVVCELGIEEAFPVDTHVFRVSRRLGLSKAQTREKLEVELRELFDKRHWQPLHHQLIFHGRRVCKAKKPMCTECGLNRICPKLIETATES
jgi:endonuclease III